MWPFLLEDKSGQARTNNTRPAGYHSGRKIESRRPESNRRPPLYEGTGPPGAIFPVKRSLAGVRRGRESNLWGAVTAGLPHGCTTASRAMIFRPRSTHECSACRGSVPARGGWLGPGRRSRSGRTSPRADGVPTWSVSTTTTGASAAARSRRCAMPAHGWTTTSPPSDAATRACGAFFWISTPRRPTSLRRARSGSCSSSSAGQRASQQSGWPRALDLRALRVAHWAAHAR
jgi:hypothetical protein